MLRIIGLTIAVLGMIVALIDFRDLTGTVEKQLQKLKTKLSDYVNFVTEQRPVPESQRQAFKQFVEQRVGPYEIILFVAVFLSMLAFYLWQTYSLSPLTADSPWIELILGGAVIFIICVVSAFVVAVIGTILIIATVCFIGFYIIGLLLMILSVLSIPRKGVIGTLALITALGGFLLEVFGH